MLQYTNITTVGSRFAIESQVTYYISARGICGIILKSLSVDSYQSIPYGFRHRIATTYFRTTCSTTIENQCIVGIGSFSGRIGVHRDKMVAGIVLCL